MTNLHVHWRLTYLALGSLRLLTTEALLERLRPVAELTDQALKRLVRRLQARYPIALPLRADAEVTTLVSWLEQAGATVELSSPTARVGAP